MESPKNGRLTSPLAQMTYVKKYATTEPRTVLNKLLPRAAPMSIHQGRLWSNDEKSLPMLTLLLLFICSRVIRKQSRKRMKQADAIAIMANCVPVALEPS